MSTALIQLSKGKKALVSFGAIMLTVAVACYGLALMTLVPPILQRLDGMAFAGLVGLCISLGITLLSPIGGKLGDIFGRKAVVVIAGLVNLICGIGIVITSTTTALGYSLLPFQPFAEGTAWLDLWDFLVSYNLLPLGSLVFVMFCCNKRYGWGWENFLAEANTGKGLKVKNWMKPVFCYVVPAAVIIIYIMGLISFPWK